MPATDIRILSIAPYRFLPLRNGGHQAIAKLHHYIGLQCPDHVISTTGNADNPFAFTLHKLFPDQRHRYIPRYALGKVLQVAKANNCTHIICEHPYMAFTAMAVSSKLGIPWFMRSHNIESERYRAFGKPWWPGLRAYERYAMQQANGIFFITPEDAQWAVKNFELPAAKCHDIPFGTDLQAPPAGHLSAKAQLAAEMGISKDVPWLYFLGALDYSPNAEAVKYILEEVQPRLDKSGQPYEILIAGNGLDEALQLEISNKKHIQYTGFVNDLDLFLKACDVMLNPVLKGGGIKTKAVEALGYNKTVVSTANGAAGLLPAVCGSQLLIAPDFQWDDFTNLVLQAMHCDAQMPDSFYHTYYHGHIANKVLRILDATR